MTKALIQVLYWVAIRPSGGVWNFAVAKKIVTLDTWHGVLSCCSWPSGKCSWRNGKKCVWSTAWHTELFTSTLGGTMLLLLSWRCLPTHWFWVNASVMPLTLVSLLPFYRKCSMVFQLIMDLYVKTMFSNLLCKFLHVHSILLTLFCVLIIWQCLLPWNIQPRSIRVQIIVLLDIL